MNDFSLQDIPEEYLAAVRRYVTSDFSAVDSALRRLDPARLQELDGFIQQITYGLLALPAFRGVVYRGTTLSAAAARQYVPGNVVFERSFVSATADPARRYPGDSTFVIASINGRDVSALADSPDEREVVFFTGTWFKVLAVEQDVAASEFTVYLAEIPVRRLYGPDAEE